MPRPWLRRLAACLLALALGAGMAGCGVKGPPERPKVPIVPGL